MNGNSIMNEDLVLENRQTLRNHDVLVFNPLPGPSYPEDQEVGPVVLL